MKRFWHTFLAIVAVAALANTANAQFSPGGEIGSYQSILSRAGYGGDSGGSMMANQAPMQTSPGTAMSYGAPSTSCANGNCGGGYTAGAYTSGTSYGGQVGTNTTPGAYGAYGYSNGVVQGAPVQAGVVNGGMVPAQGPVVNGYAGNVEGGAVIDQGYVGGPASPIINYSQPSQVTYGPSTWSQPVYSEPAYSQPVYSSPVFDQPTYQTTPVYVAGESFAPRRRASNLVVGLFGINLRRDYEDPVKLGYAPNGDFFSRGVEHGNMTGYGVSLASRKSNGTGWEARYWGLDETDSRDYGHGFTHLTGLDAVYHTPVTSSIRALYNNAEGFTVGRSTEINSLAFNMLRNGGRFQTRGGKCGNYEMLAGFRIFQFDEDLSYIANSAAYPTRLEYGVETENLLTGFQVGARNEICLSKRFRLAKGFNVGIFNNRINTSQRIFDETGYEPTINSGPYAGTPYNFQDQKDDVAFLGEFNAGLIMQLSKKARLNVGYRAIGVAGVALAADQIPHDFTDVRALQSARSNGSLLLHGFYYGAEFCF